MKTLTLGLALLFGAFLFSGCSETKDTTDTTNNEVKNETSQNQVETQNSQTQQDPNTSHDELTAQEKAGEEITNNEKTSAKDNPTKIKTKDSKLESASFTAASMHCSGCEQTITGSVGKLDGVQSVTANFDSKQVEVVFASDKVTKDDILKTIQASGFECKINN